MNIYAFIKYRSIKNYFRQEKNKITKLLFFYSFYFVSNKHKMGNELGQHIDQSQKTGVLQLRNFKLTKVIFKIFFCLNIF